MDEQVRCAGNSHIVICVRRQGGSSAGWCITRAHVARGGYAIHGCGQPELIRNQRSLAMKKMFFLITSLGLLMSACLPASLQPDAASPAPISEADLQATAAVLSQQTLQALPTFTVPPSNTPVVTTPTATQATPTETQDPAALTLTATLNTSIT